MTSFDIDTLTVKQAREIASMFGDAPEVSSPPKDRTTPFEVGENYFIRTVTHYLVGKLVGVTETELVLVDASWIADTGRFNEALRTGKFSEVECFPPKKNVLVGRGALIDAAVWDHSLPTKSV